MNKAIRIYTVISMYSFCIMITIDCKNQFSFLIL